MQEHVTSAANELANAANTKASIAATVTNTSVAGGLVATTANPQAVESVKLGMWLQTNGIGFVSWMEVIQIIGAFYILFKLSTEFYDRFIAKSPRGTKDGQQTGIKTTD